MDQMPYKVKQKIRKLNRLIQEAQSTQDELTRMFESYGIYDLEVFISTSNVDVDMQTEDLAFILNGETRNQEALEESIKNIESVFLIHAKEDQLYEKRTKNE